VLLVVGGIKALQIKKLIGMGATMVPPPTTVTSAKVEQANWQPTFTAVGSVAAVQGATISAELAGTGVVMVSIRHAGWKIGDVCERWTLPPNRAAAFGPGRCRPRESDFDRARDLACAEKVHSAAEMGCRFREYTQRNRRFR
jgi:membrane fusion protein (multidrug efflux system)